MYLALMGAYGMALLAAETAEELQKEKSTLLDSDGLNSFTSIYDNA